jgi:hypothetical protein
VRVFSAVVSIFFLVLKGLCNNNSSGLSLACYQSNSSTVCDSLTCILITHISGVLQNSITAYSI